VASILIVEIEEMGINGVQMKGVLLPWVIRWARRAVKKDFYPDLAPPVRPVQNIFFLTSHYLTLIVPIAQ
jgi:hypothetical protein